MPTAQTVSLKIPEIEPKALRTPPAFPQDYMSQYQVPVPLTPAELGRDKPPAFFPEQRQVRVPSGLLSIRKYDKLDKYMIDTPSGEAQPKYMRFRSPQPSPELLENPNYTQIRKVMNEAFTAGTESRIQLSPEALLPYHSIFKKL